MKRRNFLVAGMAGVLSACGKIGETETFVRLVEGAQGWHRGLHRNLSFGRIPMAPEYTRAEVSPSFRGNGSKTVDTPEYEAAIADGFAQWTLEIGGLVEKPLVLTMDAIRALPQRTQITRHDCVEGWSAIGEWTGPQLSAILAAARVQDGAKFIVFHCADNLGGADYYESCDLDDAFHPQTIVAHRLNGQALPIKNGAPLRLRLERQLGYKHPKYLTRIEAVASLDDIHGGKGGYWEDRADYQWYGGI